MTTITQSIPSLGSPPLTTDPANFDTRADTLYGTSLPAVITATNTWSGQANTVAGEVNTNATTASTNATASATARAGAEAAQAAAESASNATQWVSGQAYVEGDVVWSPSSYLSYRATGATSGTVDPSQSASWVLLAANVPKFTNPLAQAVRVAMTAAASGSTGIQVASKTVYDLGTSDYTLVWKGSQPDWTPSAVVRLLYKFSTVDNRWGIYLNTNGTLTAQIVTGGVAQFQPSSTVATGLADGAYAEIAVVVTRQTASVAGSVAFYVNGVQLGASVAITAAALVTGSNAGPLYISGDNAIRYASDNLNSTIYNRALSAAEVLSLCVNGPALADIGASQVPIYTSDFSAGADGFASIDGGSVVVAGNVDSIDGEDDWCSAERSGTSGGLRAVRSGSYVPDKNNRTVIRVHNGHSSALNIGVTNSSGSLRDGFFAAQPVPAGESRDYVFEGYAPLSTSMTVGCFSSTVAGATIVSVPAGAKIYWKLVETKQIGITGQWNAQDAQSNTGQIFDTSGNKNHALLPAAGATIIGRPTAQQRQVRWTNTWAGTNELQYIGGVNQAILPANAYIESIVGTVSGATPHDIIIGNGSDTDRYVTITTGLAAGTTSFTLANRTTDGTNLKLTVDPDTNATMSIAWVITYTTLES